MEAPQNCPKCGSKTKLVPAGISKKSGKPYSEFWACSNRDCNWTWNEPKADIATQRYEEEMALLEEINLGIRAILSNQAKSPQITSQEPKETPRF